MTAAAPSPFARSAFDESSRLSGREQTVSLPWQRRVIVEMFADSLRLAVP
jgi:hypothetical protein